MKKTKIFRFFSKNFWFFFEKFLKIFENFLKIFEIFLKILKQCLPSIHLVYILKCSNFFVRGPILIILKPCNKKKPKVSKEMRTIASYPLGMMVYSIWMYNMLVNFTIYIMLLPETFLLRQFIFEVSFTTILAHLL